MLAVCHVNRHKIEIRSVKKRPNRWKSAACTIHTGLLTAFLCLVMFLILALSDSLDAVTIWLLKKKQRFGRKEDKRAEKPRSSKGGSPFMKRFEMGKVIKI